jgi:hypothetical protein
VNAAGSVGPGWLGGRWAAFAASAPSDHHVWAGYRINYSVASIYIYIYIYMYIYMYVCILFSDMGITGI